MDKFAQNRAIETYRTKLRERGIARFEVQAPQADRDLIRAVARKLTDEGPGAQTLRQALVQAVADVPRERGGILRVLRRSPLVGTDLDFTRARDVRRKIDL